MTDVAHRVLVTGAAGFIGRETIAPLRERGFDVHGVFRSSSAPEIEGVTWHRCDLLDHDSTVALTGAIRATHLLHFAWYTVHGKFYSAPENAAWVEASMALVHGFAAAGGQRALLAGTCAEYDWNAGTCTEGVTPLDPDSVYGAAKKELYGRFEQYCREKQLSGAWGRVFFAFGPHEHPDRLASAVIRSLLEGRPARTSHGRQKRDYAFVRDIAEGFVALLASDVTGAVNVASGKAIELRELIECAATVAGREDLLEIGALPARENDVDLIVADTGRIRNEVGWEPRYDLHSALVETVAWWRDNLDTKENNTQ